MKRSLLKTADGSYTLHLADWDEQYHSKHGAIAEALHVFIKSGLLFQKERQPDLLSITILEIGFGTGLNAALTKQSATGLNLTIDYTGVEKYPVTTDELNALNYPELLKITKQDFLSLHKEPWGQPQKVESNFTLTKKQMDFSQVDDQDVYDLIYFDAFGPRVQPDLWTQDIFKKMYHALTTNGVLVTYSAKGDVRRAMQAVGFEVERLPGPPFKRHMLRAVKV